MALPPSDPVNSSSKSAKDAAQNDVFMREVDDAVRADQMEGFFKRYGLPLIGAIVLGLAAFGGFLFWQHNAKAAKEEHAEKFVQALDDLDANNLKAADGKLTALAGEGTAGSEAMAKLMRAGIALSEDRAPDAIKLYGEVANDTDVPQPLRDLATVRQVAANFDKLPPQTVVDRLKPLAEPGNAWFGVAGELVGVAYLKQGKENLAGPLFAKIARDETQPDSLRARARQLAGILGQDALDDVIDENGDKQDEDGAIARAAAPTAATAR